MWLDDTNKLPVGEVTLAWVLAGGSFCLPLRKLTRTGTCSPRFLTAKQQACDLYKEARIVHYNIRSVAGGSIQCPVEWQQSWGMWVSIQQGWDKQIVQALGSGCVPACEFPPFLLTFWACFSGFPNDSLMYPISFPSIGFLLKLPRVVTNDKSSMLLSTTKCLIPWSPEVTF